MKYNNFLETKYLSNFIYQYSIWKEQFHIIQSIIEHLFFTIKYIN